MPHTLNNDNVKFVLSWQLLQPDNKLLISLLHIAAPAQKVKKTSHRKSWSIEMLKDMFRARYNVTFFFCDNEGALLIQFKVLFKLNVQ